MCSQRSVVLRDYSHGKVRPESIKDYGSYRLRVDGALRRITGNGLFEWQFTESDIRKYMPHCIAYDCARYLLEGTDYYRGG